MKTNNGSIIIGLCGSTISARREAMELLSECLNKVADVTISGGVRAPWLRGDGLASKLEEFAASNDADAAIAMITHREEAEAIEAAGGHVIHVEGTPSDEIAIKLNTILLTLKPTCRGRYTTVRATLEKLGVPVFDFDQAA